MVNSTSGDRRAKDRVPPELFLLCDCCIYLSSRPLLVVVVVIINLTIIDMVG